VLVAAGKLLKPGYDWFYPYYRDRALCLQLGMTPNEMFPLGLAAADDPNSGGRQMPSHWAPGAQHRVAIEPHRHPVLQAVGAAEAIVKYRDLEPTTPEFKGKVHGDEVVLVTTGDGATSEGEFWRR